MPAAHLKRYDKMLVCDDRDGDERVHEHDQLEQHAEKVVVDRVDRGQEQLLVFSSFAFGSAEPVAARTVGGRGVSSLPSCSAARSCSRLEQRRSGQKLRWASFARSSMNLLACNAFDR